MKLLEHLVVDLTDNGIEPVKARAFAAKLYAPDDGEQPDARTTYGNICDELVELTKDIEDLTRLKNALSAIRDKWAMHESTKQHAPPESPERTI